MFRNKKVAAVGIIGLGRFGMALAKRLCELGKEVLVIDENVEKVKELREYTEYAFLSNNLSKEALEETGIQNCEVVIICIGERIDASFLATLNVVSLGVPRVISRANSDEQGNALKMIGAEVVYPEHDMAIRLAKRIVERNVMDYITLNSKVELSEMIVPTKLVGKSVKEADLNKRYGLNIAAIRHGDDIILEVDRNYIFSEQDAIVVLGYNDGILALKAD